MNDISDSRINSKSIVRQSICSLENGEANIRWPSGLSENDRRDMAAWLKLITLQVERDRPVVESGEGERR